MHICDASESIECDAPFHHAYEIKVKHEN